MVADRLNRYFQQEKWWTLCCIIDSSSSTQKCFIGLNLMFALQWQFEGWWCMGRYLWWSQGGSNSLYCNTSIRAWSKRRRRNLETKRRDRDFSDVDCPMQQWIFCCTYHSIGKGNGAEAKYGLSTESNLHGWGPNLAAGYFNMTLKMPTKFTNFFTTSTILE